MEQLRDQGCLHRLFLARILAVVVQTLHPLRVQLPLVRGHCAGARGGGVGLLDAGRDPEHQHAHEEVQQPRSLGSHQLLRPASSNPHLHRPLLELVHDKLRKQAAQPHDLFEEVRARFCTDLLPVSAVENRNGLDHPLQLRDDLLPNIDVEGRSALVVHPEHHEATDRLENRLQIWEAHLPLIGLHILRQLIHRPEHMHLFQESQED
mmetsp:Transcript_129696/g.416026  ORF Transcript_129696/g.416026 Transcript_129696/m.416026 type:complete len:207 (+) Transcript_129696:1810-2430(+)